MINTLKTRNATATCGGGLLRAASAVVSLGLFASALTFVAPVQAQTTLTVTDNTDASGPATTGSLRQVLEYAAANCYFGPYTVNFAIGSGAKTIQTFTPLPAVICQTLIDGYTQPGGASPNTLSNGSNANILISLDGSLMTPPGSGLTLSADGILVRGLAITKFIGQPGISIQSGIGVTVEGNFIGTDATGTLAAPNGIGVSVIGSSSAAVIGSSAPAGRNIISGNTGNGIEITGGGGTKIRKNQVGTDKVGTSALPNGVNGIYLNVLGTELDSNAIKFNTGNGVAVGGSGGSADIHDNDILGNGGHGVYVVGTECTAQGVAIRRNAIGNQGALGIDLGDVFFGPPPVRDNNGVLLSPSCYHGNGGTGTTGQNYPVISNISLAWSGASVTSTINATLNSAPSVAYGIDLFNQFVSGSSLIDTGNHGIGASYVSSITTAATDATGLVAFSMLAAGAPVYHPTMTASTPVAPTGGTSEISVQAVTPLIYTSTYTNYSITAGGAQSQTFTFRNDDVVAVTVPLPTTNLAAFTVTSSSCASVTPGASCAVVVTYSRATATPLDLAVLTLGPISSASAPVAPVGVQPPVTYTWALTGTALAASAPAVTLTPPTVVFGARTVSTTSPPTTVSLGNSGTALLSITGITVTGDFGFTTSCPLSPSTLAVGIACPINITFTPLTAVAKTGSVTIVSNAPGSPHTIALTGTGTAGAAPGISLTPAALSFGPLTVATTSATQNVVVTNTGFANLVLSTITIAAPFTRVPLGTVTPPDCGTTVAPAGKCQIGVSFSPTTVGTFTGQISIADNVVGTPHLVPLTGVSTPVPVPVIRTSASVAFGDQVINSIAAEQSLVITNVGTAILSVSALTLTGTNAANFKVTGQSGCTSIAPAASCTLTVTFAPITLGTKSAQINITSDAQNAALVNTVSLTGNGILAPRPLVSFSATAVGYGNVIFGGATPNQVITLTNSGGQAMNISGMLITGDFVQVNNCGTSLASLASCTISIFFTPLAQGNRIGEFVLTTSAATSPDRIQLAGTGCRWFSQSQSRFFLTNCGL